MVPGVLHHQLSPTASVNSRKLFPVLRYAFQRPRLTHVGATVSVVSDHVHAPQDVALGVVRLAAQTCPVQRGKTHSGLVQRRSMNQFVWVTGPSVVPKKKPRLPGAR
jgi:hypothetical protein